MRHFLAAILILLTVACSRSTSEESLFSIEPKHKASFSPTRTLRQGDTLEFMFDGLRQNEQLNVFRCGRPCSTAKFITSWQGSDNEARAVHEITIAEEGEYYFWVKQSLPSGETGPVFIESARNADGFYTVNFASGSVVGIRFKP